jgi:RNA ligase
MGGVVRFDWDELRTLQAEKLLTIVPHDSGEYWLLNYAPKAQYENTWDAHPVLLDCRGTIIRADGSVVAKPFRKFFNLGERPETQMDALASLGEPEIAHKLDGSMITLWRDDAGGIHFATRGSFTSPQAQMARVIWNNRHADAAPYLHPNLTYVFELVGPDNRIVVHYPDTALILTGAVWTLDGKECAYAGVASEAARLHLPAVEAQGGSWADLAALERGNFEGFVLYWYGRWGERRVKVKLAEYIRLHRIITGLSEHTVWEILRDGGDVEALRREIPEEMHAWFDGVTTELSRLHMRRVASVDDALRQIVADGLNPKDRVDRKEIALWVKRSCPDISGAVFRALDDKDYLSLIWKEIEPKATPLFADREG